MKKGLTKEQLLTDEIEETRARLEAWVMRELDDPVEEGKGRNNQMIQLAPRMLELGFDEEGIFERFKAMYDLEDDISKDEEIMAVIRRAEKYVTEIRIEDPEEIKRQKKEAAERMRAALRVRETVMTKYTWTEGDIRAAGGVAHLSPKDQRAMFLWNMFGDEDTLWCGRVYHSGQDKHRRNFQPRAHWLGNVPPGFEFTSHCTWHPGSFSRCTSSVAERRYLVVESDELGRDEIGAVFAWLAAGGLHLRAVVYSGSRSLHGWFNWPDNPSDLASNLVGLRCDPSVMRAAQPVRLPGMLRKDTNAVQELLYLSK